MLPCASRPSTPRTPGQSTPGSQSDAYHTAHETPSSVGDAQDTPGFATPLSSPSFTIGSYTNSRAQEAAIREWAATQMGSSQSTPKPEDGTARKASTPPRGSPQSPGKEAHSPPHIEDRDTSPAMHTRSSSKQDAHAVEASPSSYVAAASTTPVPSTSRARATRRTVQSTVPYPDLTPLKDQTDAASAETPGEDISPSAARQNSTSASPKRSPPTAVVVIPTTVPDLTSSLRSRGLEKQANALEALQEQARKDPGSATLLEALLAGRKLTERMNRDWQRYVNDVEIVKKGGESNEDTGQQGKKRKAKRKRAVEEADDEGNIETVEKPMKLLKMDDSQIYVKEDGVPVETAPEASSEQEQPTKVSRPVRLTEQEKRQRKKEKNRRRHPHPPKNTNADRPNRIVLDVADTAVVLKRRKHKGSRGLGRRKKAVLARKELQTAQEQAGLLETS